MISDIRNIIYTVRDDLKFKLDLVTLDGFNSTDTMQQLRKRRFRSSYLSVDRTTLPYEDLRDAIYEGRLEFPPYLTYVNFGDDKPVQIAVRELLMLQDVGRKIDHPKDGSKDVADSLAGVVTSLMGDRTYHRGIAYGDSGPSEFRPESDADTFAGMKMIHTEDLASSRHPGLPVIDTGMATDNPFAITIPARLRRRR